MAFSVELDHAEVTAALGELQGRLASLRAPMAEIGQHLVTLADLSFRHERDPWGRAWQRLAASTLRRRRTGKGKGGAKILRDTGHLAKSITYRADDRSVTVGTNVVYAAIHQFGGEIQHAARTSTLYFRQRKDGTVGNRFVRRGRSNFAQDVETRAHTVTMPRRAYLPISEGGEVDLPADAVSDILDTLARHLQGALR